MSILREIRPAVSLVVLFTVFTGFILPEAFTGVMQVALPALMGTDAKGNSIPTPYDASESGASNLAPTSAALLATVKQRVAAYTKAYGPGPVPADAVTASGSGLDPDISLENALRQAPAIASARKLPPDTVLNLVNQMTHHAALGIVGTDHLNVLQLNLALDQLPAA
jgi:K+-transporting ATPase ATPase C chain